MDIFYNTDVFRKYLLNPEDPRCIVAFRKKVVDTLNKAVQDMNERFGRLSRGRMVVGFTTTYSISAYHH
jgi:hypothetical protein